MTIEKVVIGKKSRRRPYGYKEQICLFSTHINLVTMNLGSN